MMVRQTVHVVIDGPILDKQAVKMNTEKACIKVSMVMGNPLVEINNIQYG